jgi:hypothetical protein
MDTVDSFVSKKKKKKKKTMDIRPTNLELYLEYEIIPTP